MRGVEEGHEASDGVEEWQLVKDLVDRRVFRWTQLFACLAATLPDDVRLTGITPSVSKGKVTLEVEAVVKSMGAGLAFIQRLEERPEFHDVYPKGIGDSRPGQEEFRYVMQYLAEAVPRPAGAGQ